MIKFLRNRGVFIYVKRYEMFSLYEIRMYIHIYSIICIWILGYIIENKDIGEEDTNNLIRLFMRYYDDIIGNSYIYLDEDDVLD